MKKIWIFDHYSSEPQYGGYTRQYNFANCLTKYGYDVTIFSSTFNHHTHEYISQEKSFVGTINDNSRYLYFKTKDYDKNSSPMRFVGMFQYVFYIVNNYKNLTKRFGIPDYVVGSCPHSFTWVVASIISRKAKAKFIAEVRDFWPLELKGDNDDFIHRLFYWLLQKIEDKTFLKADAIISTLPYGYKYICDERGFDRDKVFWLGQPINCDRFDLLANERKIPKDIDTFIDGKFVCVFAGYYMSYEGIYMMLEAAEEILSINNKIVFLFCGSGKEEEKMKILVREKNLTNVMVHERINKELMPALLKKADVCLSCIINETKNNEYKYGLSKNKINEYLFSGAITLMGYDYPGNQVSDSKGGFVFNTNRNEFKDLILKVFNMSADEREQIVSNARNYVINNYDIDVLTKKYCDILGKLDS